MSLGQGFESLKPRPCLVDYLCFMLFAEDVISQLPTLASMLATSSFEVMDFSCSGTIR